MHRLNLRERTDKEEEGWLEDCIMVLGRIGRQVLRRSGAAWNILRWWPPTICLMPIRTLIVQIRSTYGVSGHRGSEGKESGRGGKKITIGGEDPERFVGRFRLAWL